MALVMISAGAFSSLSLYLALLTVVPISMVYAPQKVRRDKRVVVAFVLLVLAVIGLPVFAADTNICKYAWWAFECWFL